MFSPRTGKGKELASWISKYKTEILAQIEDPVQKKIISDNLTLNIPRLFEGTPVAAAVTLLTKLQSDIRYAEGEVLHTLTKDIDVHDVRVNQINAYVIPSSQNVVRGGKLSAQTLPNVLLSTLVISNCPKMLMDFMRRFVILPVSLLFRDIWN